MDCQRDNAQCPGIVPPVILMARRKEESNIDLLLSAPWWVSALVAVAGLVALQWIIPAITTSNPMLKVLGLGFKPVGYLVGASFGLIAAVNFFRQRPSHRVAPSDSAREYRPSPIPTGTPTTDQVIKTWEDMMAAAPRPEPKPESKPTAWSLELLRRIEWKRFEELPAAFYREIGLRSETIRCGADGGIDAKLFKGDATEPTAIVQCKAWNCRSVGVKPVRELLGVMTHQHTAEGIFIATGDFTKEAIDFAKSNPIDLVSGSAFMDMIQKLPAEAQQRLLSVATESEFTTPSCPSCGIKRVWRESERGDFWGYRNYPRCKQIFHVASTM
jgi:restriction system protein